MLVLVSSRICANDNTNSTRDMQVGCLRNASGKQVEYGRNASSILVKCGYSVVLVGYLGAPMQYFWHTQWGTRAMPVQYV